MKGGPSVLSSVEIGSLGVLHLKRLWSRATSAHRGHVSERRRADEWIFDKIVIHGLGLALEDTLQYLSRNAPSYEQFERWILERNGGSLERDRIERINATISGADYSEKLKDVLEEIKKSDPVLKEEDLVFWEENGYVVVHDAVTAENCLAAEQAIWAFLGMDAEDSDTWYQRQEAYGIMAQLFHHPALTANRNSRRIHKAFAQIWGTADVWMSIDRVSFNPPEREGWRFPGPHLHWDTSLALPIPFDVSGLLYLTDTTAEQGAFTCVPGFHRRITDWLQSLPPDANPRAQNLEQLGPTSVAGKAGDLIIWHKALPHGSRPNHASRPRIVQYLTMYSSKVKHNPKWR